MLLIEDTMAELHGAALLLSTGQVRNTHMYTVYPDVSICGVYNARRCCVTWRPTADQHHVLISNRLLAFLSTPLH